MELRHLRYFVAVADAMSFTGAAKNLRLAQPSLTRQVRNLEDEIGVRLLDRNHNRIALTTAGRRFHLDAKNILALSAESIVAARRTEREESLQLNIGYVASTDSGLLPASLEAFRKFRPVVDLNLFDLGTAEQFASLDSRQLDLGFVGFLPALSGHDLVSECVAHETMLVALPARHALVKKPKIQLADLAPEFFVSLSSKAHPGTREWLLDTCLCAGFAPRILQEVDSDSSALKFSADELGVALMPERTTKLHHEGVAFRPLSPPLRRELTIAWRSDNSSKPLQDYIQIVKTLAHAA